MGIETVKSAYEVIVLPFGRESFEPCVKLLNQIGTL